jgi:hypothetical protein
MSTPMQKKQFRDPELVVYGDIRSITQNIVGGSGMNDNIMGNDKTAL